MAKKTKQVKSMNFNYLRLGNQIMMSTRQWKRVQAWLRRAGVDVRETTLKKK